MLVLKYYYLSIMKKICSIIILLVIQINSFSQVEPSVYAGMGLGTNLGGMFGVGTEIKYKIVSFNAAVGTWTDEFPEHTGAKSRFDYDVGLKLYSEVGLYAGLNYGIIGAALYTKTGQDLLHYEKTHGFSFTIGYKRNIYKNTFASFYLGLTSNQAENHISVFDNSSFLPRIGILLGYDFKNNNNKTSRGLKFL